MVIQRIEAVLFDMDGTLIDSEKLTELVIADLLRERGLPPERIDFESFHGITWAATARVLQQDFPELAAEPLDELLPRRFQERFVAAFPPLIPGARQAVVAASARYPTAIVTSSSAGTVEHLLDHLDLRSHLRCYVSAEACRRSKPDPEGYLLAAERLRVPPARCLVFEDSAVGLEAAKRAGMTAVAITGGVSAAGAAAVAALADEAVPHFEALPADFFETIGAEAGR